MNVRTEMADTEQACPWENGTLGDSVEHAVPVSREHAKEVDDSLGLQMISIRLPKRLIEDLKLLAEKEGLGYQPLIRRQLLRYVAGEFRNMAHGYAVPSFLSVDQTGEPPCDDESPPARRVAAG